MAVRASLLVLVASSHLAARADGGAAARPQPERHVAMIQKATSKSTYQMHRKRVGATSSAGATAHAHQQRVGTASRAHRSRAGKDSEFPEGSWDWPKLPEYDSPYGKEWLLDSDYISNEKSPTEEFDFSSTPTTTSSTTTTTTTVATTMTTTTTKLSACHTLFDERDTGLFSQNPTGFFTYTKQAKNDTACMFGVDDRDEGSHCIHENGKYGTFGWCWTDKDRTEWGTCMAGCPLWGQPENLEQQVQDLSSKLSKAEHKLAPLLKLAEGEGKAKAAKLTQTNQTLTRTNQTDKQDVKAKPPMSLMETAGRLTTQQGRQTSHAAELARARKTAKKGASSRTQRAGAKPPKRAGDATSKKQTAKRAATAVAKKGSSKQAAKRVARRFAKAVAKRAAKKQTASRMTKAVARKRTKKGASKKRAVHAKSVDKDTTAKKM